MSIERLIHGSIILYSGEDKHAGYQCYALTKGLEGASERTINHLTTSYDAPKINDYADIFSESICKIDEKDPQKYELKKNELANEASHIAQTLQPASLSFSSMEIDGSNRCVFVYGKDMGISWDGGRPFGAYHSVVICDIADIPSYPILLCSSPIVCCDIPREEFFPNDGSKVLGPVQLNYLPTLIEKNNVKLKHSAGFSEINEGDLFAFIQADNRIEILKSMVSALINLKSGNEQCRIVIADERKLIAKWIAAISYVFPLELAIDISFSTYRYRLDNSFDINGVYVPQLNGRKLIDDFPVTEYIFEENTNRYAVYDFQQQSFAPQVEICENLFMSMLENAFLINKQIIDGYKSFIIASTTYRKIDSGYMDGATLYMFLEKNKHLTVEQMKAALSFAKQYAVVKEKKRILDRILSAYKDYTSDSDMLDVIVEFIRYCVDQNIVRQADLESIFMNDVKNAFLDYTNCSFDTFSIQGVIAEKLCGFRSGQMEVALVSTIGVKQLYDIMNELQKYREVQRISYIHTAICHYVNDNNGSFKRGTYEEKIACKIISVFIIGETLDNEKRLHTLMDKTNQIITNVISQFLYADAVYRTIYSKGYKDLSKNVLERIATAYIFLTPEQRINYVNAVDMSETSKTYLQVILMAIRSEYEPSERITVLTEAITNNRKSFSEFILPIKRIALDTEGYNVNSSFYFKVFYFFKICEKYHNNGVDKTEIQNLLTNYIKCLYSEHKDFILDDEKTKELKTINHEFENIRNNSGSFSLVCAFLLISEMNRCIDGKSQCVFNGYNRSLLVDYSKLRGVEQSSLIESAGKLLAAYWINTAKAPKLDNLFIFADVSQQIKAYNYLFGELLDNVLNSKSRNRFDVAAKVIEYGVFYRLSSFLGDLPEILTNKVKQNDILRPLEKDIELKIRLKAQKGVLAQIDTIELQEVVHSIASAYEEKKQNSTLGKAKRAFGNFMSSFKKDKKDE